MDKVCERLDVRSTFGIGMNSRLKAASDDLLRQAVEQHEQTGQKQRLFTALSYQAGSWDRTRSVVIKAEAHAAGTNRRAVVTNHPGALIVPQGVYDDYVQRGESDRHRRKECGCAARGLYVFFVSVAEWSVSCSGYFGMRSSNIMAKWLRAGFHFGTGIVHFFEASLIAT